jgi:hypothetical protein
MSKVLYILILSLFLTTCSVVNAEEQSPLVDYGNGVLYFYNSHEIFPSFGNTYQDFGASLSQYLVNHPNKRVALMVPDGSAGGGAATLGFYVVVENKSVSEANCLPTRWNETSGRNVGFADYRCNYGGE